MFDFSDIITKSHPPFQNPGSALQVVVDEAEGWITKTCNILLNSAQTFQIKETFITTIHSNLNIISFATVSSYNNCCVNRDQ